MVIHWMPLTFIVAFLSIQNNSYYTERWWNVKLKKVFWEILQKVAKK